jgi:hypothetical protein
MTRNSLVIKSALSVGRMDMEQKTVQTERKAKAMTC